MTPTDTSGLLGHKHLLEERIRGGSSSPKPPQELLCDDIEVIKEVFQHREDSQWSSAEHVKTLVSAIKHSSSGPKKRPLSPLTVFWVGDAWVVIDGHHRLLAYQEIDYSDPVPVEVFEGTLDEAIGEALKGNSKDKLSMSKSEKTNAAWRLVISTGLSLNKMMDLSTISRQTLVTMRKVRTALLENHKDIDLGELQWREALRKSQGKEEEPYEYDFEWRDKEIEDVVRTMNETFGGRFKTRPEVFWDAMWKYDSRLMDYFLRKVGVNPEDYSQEEEEEENLDF